MSRRKKPSRQSNRRRRQRQRELRDLTPVQTCQLCGCTEDDCEQCVVRTGSPCRWVGPDLCSACAGAHEIVTAIRDLLRGGAEVLGLVELEDILESYRGEGGGN